MSSNPLTEAELVELKRLHAFARDGNYYSLLGVTPDADQATIQEAYYQLSRDWHPDRHFRRGLGEDAQKVEVVFVQITKAYKVLGSADTRRRYHRDNKAMISQARETTRAVPNPEPKADAPERKRRKRPRTAAEKTVQERIANKRKDPRARALKQLREQVKERSTRARRYFKQGQEDYTAGNVSKAVSSLHLAVQFDPKNSEYRALYELARTEASSSMAVQFVQAGESAENFGKLQEAMHNYQRACEQNPDDGLPFYRLAMLILKVEQDQRGALTHLRKAASKSPRNINIRLELADLYSQLNMGLNARREYQTVLEMDKNNSRAKTGMRNVR
jgi:tetratricopeptide (TPR) repeat protein